MLAMWPNNNCTRSTCQRVDFSLLPIFLRKTTRTGCVCVCVCALDQREGIFRSHHLPGGWHTIKCINTKVNIYVCHAKCGIAIRSGYRESSSCKAFSKHPTTITRLVWTKASATQSGETKPHFVHTNAKVYVVRHICVCPMWTFWSLFCGNNDVDVCYWLNNWVWISQCGVLAGIVCALCDNPINLGHWSDQATRMSKSMLALRVDKLSPWWIPGFSICCWLCLYGQYCTINCPMSVRISLKCVAHWIQIKSIKYLTTQYVHIYKQKRHTRNIQNKTWIGYHYQHYTHIVVFIGSAFLTREHLKLSFILTHQISFKNTKTGLCFCTKGWSFLDPDLLLWDAHRARINLWNMPTIDTMIGQYLRCRSAMCIVALTTAQGNAWRGVDRAP